MYRWAKYLILDTHIVILIRPKLIKIISYDNERIKFVQYRLKFDRCHALNSHKIKIIYLRFE